jgi:hypothetical protein
MISDTLAAGKLMYNQLTMPGMLDRLVVEDIDAANDALMGLAHLVDHITEMPIEAFDPEEINFVNSIVEFLTATLPSGPEDAPDNWEESS